MFHLNKMAYSCFRVTKISGFFEFGQHFGISILLFNNFNLVWRFVCSEVIISFFISMLWFSLEVEGRILKVNPNGSFSSLFLLLLIINSEMSVIVDSHFAGSPEVSFPLTDQAIMFSKSSKKLITDFLNVSLSFSTDIFIIVFHSWFGFIDSS